MLSITEVLVGGVETGPHVFSGPHWAPAVAPLADKDEDSEEAVSCSGHSGGTWHSHTRTAQLLEQDTIEQQLSICGS